ncbi:histone-lysine N-methyltransferase SUVR4 [Artemisia annua]|uniref:Histone-lysine N-methyltransferase SUVR4 n=1 Tax=Artemisia annua TaxID=35608 RepID=A0A2U1MS00_ARTAN|nr:histone-lysine N-methyltransferase SUVR4 [Artemisia annua]
MMRNTSLKVKEDRHSTTFYNIPRHTNLAAAVTIGVVEMVGVLEDSYENQKGFGFCDGALGIGFEGKDDGGGFGFCDGALGIGFEGKDDGGVPGAIVFFFFFHLQHGFFTSRDVKAMEELTLEYGIDSNDDFHPVKAFVCKCESKHCRQTKHKNYSPRGIY